MRGAGRNRARNASQLANRVWSAPAENHSTSRNYSLWGHGVGESNRKKPPLLTHSWKRQNPSTPSLANRQNSSAAAYTTTNNINNSGLPPTVPHNRLPRLLTYEECKTMTKVMDEPAFHKLGSFSPETWRQIEHLVKSWTRFDSAEGVQASFDILERLILEQEFLLQNRKSITAETSAVQTLSETEQEELQRVSREVLQTDLLNRVIKNWRQSWKSQKTRISHQMVVTQLEGYMDRSPSLHPNRKTYNMVLDAATAKQVFPSQAQQFGERIVFDLMGSSSDNKNNNKNNTAKKPTKKPKVNGQTKLRVRCINDISPDIYTYTTLLDIYGNNQNARAAEETLNKMLRDFQRGETRVAPNTQAYTACIAAWAQSSKKEVDAVERAERLVERMQLLHDDNILENVQPNVYTYNSLMLCWAKSGRPNAGERVEELLNIMESHENKRIRPDRGSYSTAMQAWLACDNVTRAEELYKKMYGYYTHGSNPRFKPTCADLLPLLVGLEKLSSHDTTAPFRAERYLKGIIQIGDSPQLPIYNIVLSCWEHSNSPESGGRSEALLRQMKNPTKEKYGHAPVQPNINSFNSVLAAYARNGQAIQAEMIFKSMFGEYERGNKTAKPSRHSLNLVLSAWTRTKLLSASNKIKAMLKILGDLPTSGPLALKPNLVSYNTILYQLARLGTEESRAQAENIVREMEKESEISKDEEMRPDKFSYGSVMMAHASVGDVFKTKQAFERMFKQFEAGYECAKPDAVTFNYILQAIANGSRGRNRDAGNMADELFMEMVDYHESGVLDCFPTRRTFNARLSCWANSGNKAAGENADLILEEMEALAQKGHKDLQPDAITFSTAINAHAKAGNYIRAEGLLTFMLNQYSQGNNKLKPTIRTFNTVLAALARARNPRSAEKAESYLREMLTFNDNNSSMDLKPDAVTFTTVISAWADSGDERAAERAKSLFREIEIFCQQPGNDIRLDAGFYRSVMRACAVSGDTTIAEALLEEILTGNGFDNIKPDQFMFQALLRAYAESGDEDAAEKADALLKRMDHIGDTTGNKTVKPSEACFSIALECWSKCKDLRRASDRSKEILEEMERRVKKGVEQVKPTATTYVRAINTMARAGDKDRVKATLKKMYEEGVPSGVTVASSA